MKKVFSKKFGRIEFRVWETKNGEYCYHPAYEIVVWEKNWFYFHKDDFIEDPDRPGSMVRKTDDRPYVYHVSKSMFDNEETCLTVGFFREKFDDGELDGYELTFVDDRPVSVLTKDDDDDFMNVIRYAYNYLKIKVDENRYEDD